MDAINQPLLDIRDLSVAFHQPSGTSVAVDHISFEIKRGECVALVGESGSGKSVTALSVLKLLPYPAASHPSGSIRFKGRELLGLSEREIRGIRGNDISIIFQEPMTSLNPLHTIESQIGEILRLHSGITGQMARARTLELLTQVGIPEPQTRLASYPHQLSGGQRQRVMIAMALANEPDLLIADEPTTALDVTIQAQILTLLGALQAKFGMALLLITHDLGIVRKMTERVCVMSAGEIVEAGAARPDFASPPHPHPPRLPPAPARGRAAPDGARPARGRPRGDGGAGRSRVVSDPPRAAAAHGRLHQGGRRRESHRARGPDGRRGGRERLGQDDVGPGPATPAVVPGPGPLRRARAARRARQEAEAAAPRDAGRLPGSVRRPVAAHVRRADRRRR